MTTTSETKSRFGQLISKIDAKSLRENNRRVCIDCLKPRSKKNECKNVVELNFMYSIIKILCLKYCSLCNV